MAAGSNPRLVPCTIQGRRRRVPLGSTDAISLAAARDATRVIMGRVAQGHDAAMTHSRGAEGGRPSYRVEAPRALRKALADADWWERSARRLRREDLVGIFNKLSPSIARSVAAYGACFGWAVQRGAVPDTPFFKLPIRMGTKRRDRVLSDEETVEAWKAAPPHWARTGEASPRCC